MSRKYGSNTCCGPLLWRSLQVFAAEFADLGQDGLLVDEQAPAVSHHSLTVTHNLDDRVAVLDVN